MSRGRWERCQRTGWSLCRLDALGPWWVDDDGLRPDRVPAGLLAMPVSSASALAGYTNQTVGADALRSDDRWHPFEIWVTVSGTGVMIRRGTDRPPARGTFTGLIFDSPSSLGWLGGEMLEAARARMLAGRRR